MRPSLRRISQARLEVSLPPSISTAACTLTACTNFSPAYGLAASKTASITALPRKLTAIAFRFKVVQREQRNVVVPAWPLRRAFCRHRTGRCRLGEVRKVERTASVTLCFAFAPLFVSAHLCGHHELVQSKEGVHVRDGPRRPPITSTLAPGPRSNSSTCQNRRFARARGARSAAPAKGPGFAWIARALQSQLRAHFRHFQIHRTACFIFKWPPRAQMRTDPIWRDLLTFRRTPKAHAFRSFADPAIHSTRLLDSRSESWNVYASQRRPDSPQVQQTPKSTIVGSSPVVPIACSCPGLPAR